MLEIKDLYLVIKWWFGIDIVFVFDLGIMSGSVGAKHVRERCYVTELKWAEYTVLFTVLCSLTDEVKGFVM